MIHPTPRSTRTDTRVPYATCCRAAFPSSAMLARQVVGALHFDQAAAGTLECRRQPFAAIQVERPGRRAHDQVDVAIVKLIDQMHEARSEEHMSELQSLMRLSYAVFCLKQNRNKYT